MSPSPDRSCAASAVVAALPAAWLYLTKAVHIDDPVVLRAAENIARNPLRPFDGTIFWLNEPGPLFDVTTNPPLVSYWLAPWLAAWGAREWILHLAMVPFVLMVAAATAYFARQAGLGARAGWVVLAVLFGPALLPSVNLMRDVPMLGLWMAGLALWVAGLRRPSRALMAFGALTGGLASVAKYTGALWVVVAFAAVAPHQRRRALGPLLVALAPMAAWCALSWFSYGEVHVLVTGEKAASRERWGVVVAFFAGLGAVAPLWAARLWKRPLRVLGLALGAAAFAVLCRLGTGTWPGIWFATLGAGGIALAWRTAAFALAAETPLRGVLAAWVALAAVGALFLVPFQAVRHLLLLVPVAVMASMAACESERLARGAAIGTVVLGLLVQWSDWEFAKVHRDPIATLGRAAGGAERYFAGSWGWQYYAERSGFRKLAPTDAPRPGAIVAIPDRVFRAPLPPGIEARLEPHAIFSVPARCPLRVISWSAGASYYALTRLRAPFVLAIDSPLETFRLYRVRDAP